LTIATSLIVLLIFMVLPQPVYCACGGATISVSSGVWRSYDASRDCVNDAIQNYAASGDTVIVADGDATWSNQIIITKEIKFVGGDGTITISNGSTLNDIIKYAPVSNDAFEMSGFTLSGGWLLYIYNNTGAPLTRIKIHNNTFIQTADNYLIETKGDPIYGVIYSNTFQVSGVGGEMFNLLGKDSNWNNATHAYGTENAMYIEDNTFVVVDRPIDSGQGFKGMVVRYNDINFNTIDAESAFDMHGDNSSWGCGTMHGEFYGNNFSPARSGSTNLLQQRGGWTLAFNNYCAGASNFTVYLWNDFANDSGGCPSHPGNPVDEDINNSYYWSNWRVSTQFTVGFATDSYPGSEPTENEDFWNYNASFDGSVGIGCGAIASRPATCTTGVAYWATNQSCSDLSGMVGANPTTPISGTLYKCTATNTWEPYYTPYTYPHPLRAQYKNHGSPKSHAQRPPT